MSGELSYQNNRFQEERREFWWWPITFIGLVIGCVMFYNSYREDVRTKETGQEIVVNVFDKKRGERKGERRKIGIMHGHIPIYVIASSPWYRSSKIGTDTKVIYSAKYHSYLDPYNKFHKDRFFLTCMVFVTIIVLWRTIWLGLYIWYWR